MDDVLKDLGWSDGFRIPVANAENKALELEASALTIITSYSRDISDNLNIMKKHLANVQNQLNINQNLIYAHNNQKTAEENLVKLAQIEDSSLLNDIKRVKKELENTIERQKSVQNDIVRSLHNVDKLNATIKWDKDALLAWDEEMTRGDDDTFMLEKFRREDEAKFKELELRRQSLGVEVENKKNKLMLLKSDIISMEQSLDKTAQMFRRQHVDRRVLVQQWEGSVRVLNQRHDDINRIADEIRNLKLVARDRLKDLEEQKTFFENEKKNNKELEKEIENLNKQVADNKEKIMMAEQIIVEEADKLATLQTVLATTTTQFHKERNQYKVMMKEAEAKSQLCTGMKLRIEKAKAEYEASKNKTISAVERTHQLEKLLKAEEKFVERNLFEFKVRSVVKLGTRNRSLPLENCVKKLDELLHQIGQQLTELKNGEKSQLFNIRHIESCKASVLKYISKAQTEMNRQKEILYNMDFAYMEKDIQLNKMLGLLKDQDSPQHDKKIAELEEIHAKLVATSNLLTKEVGRLEDDMRRITMDLQGDTKEQEYLKNKRQENVLFVECGNKQLNALRALNQEKQVDMNLLKLRVKQAEKAIDRVGGKVFCLEKQRLELEEAMKEREIEIKTMKDILTVRRRVLNEQSAGLNSRINLARLKVDHLKSKYEVTLLKLGKDENGQPLSVTHIKIKEAQEKFELQEIGDKLDSKIKKTEKEIMAMENTLKVVNATNKAFKNNLQSIDESSPEYLEKLQLEQRQADLLEEYRLEKTVLENLENITVDLEKRYQEKLNIEASIINEWKEKDEQAAETDKEIKDQEEKLQRAGKHLKKLIKEIRGTTVQKFQTFEEKDIELREMMEQNEFGLQQLAELVAKTFDTGPVVIRYLTDKGITLPMVKSSGGSSRRSSATSVSSAGRSVASTKSSKSVESTSSRSSSCLITPSVVTLDSTKLSQFLTYQINRSDWSAYKFPTDCDIFKFQAMEIRPTLIQTNRCQSSQTWRLRLTTPRRKL
ncbi:hypothetical protein RUM43_000851 [Polyplax serrata]|uniref:Coiled-coil domain-containing protein 39 n=1 Tax=Polyplax serrata TaxID=468196 RepID=A0AAN8SEG8_POLSC